MTLLVPLPEPRRARQIVEARLGRPPQDMLEAAVVLEAWAGMPAEGALAAGRSVMPVRPAAPQASAGHVPRSGGREGVFAEGVAFVVVVAAIACWAAPLTDALGAHVVGRALTLALPVTIALQWALRSRYLARPDGPAELAAVRGAVLGLALLAGGAAIALGPAATLAALLTVIWTGGTILVRQKRTLAHVLTILAVTAALLLHEPAATVLAAGAGAIVLAVVAALRGLQPPASRPAPPPGRAVRAAAMGAAVGLLLVLDRTVRWDDATVPALLLLPSAVAGFWAGLHLRRLGRAIPAAVRGRPASAARGRRAPSGPLRVLGGAVARLLGGCALLSLVPLVLAPWWTADDGSLLAGFGLVALATLLVSLADALGRGRWALGALVCAAAAEAVVSSRVPDLAVGGGLVVGGACVIALLLPVVLLLLSRPATTLATALWIP
jgi:hypothetical protein